MLLFPSQFQMLYIIRLTHKYVITILKGADR